MTGCMVTGGRGQWALESTSHRDAKSSAWTSMSEPTLIWTGPAVAPLGGRRRIPPLRSAGMIEHPGWPRYGSATSAFIESKSNVEAHFPDGGAEPGVDTRGDTSRQTVSDPMLVNPRAVGHSRLPRSVASISHRESSACASRFGAKGLSSGRMRRVRRRRQCGRPGPAPRCRALAGPVSTSPG